MSEKKILDVAKVGFYGNTGDNRSPEDFVFPACMASLMQYLKEDYPILEMEAHNEKYTQRTANLHFITASGMAFGLLWHREYCMSCIINWLEIMQKHAVGAAISFFMKLKR